MSKKNGVVRATKPKIKRINSYEVYLVDTKGRSKKRICGIQKQNQPKGYVCTNPAGRDTGHPGYGQCSHHDRFLTNPNNLSVWAKFNKEANLPVNLMELLDAANDIEENQLTMVDDEIRLLYTLQAYVLGKRRTVDKESDKATDDGVLFTSDIELLMKLASQIIKAKDVRAKLNKELVLDTKTVKAFVNQIFKIISEETSEPVGRRIMTEIVQGVIVPYKTKGRLKGPSLDFDEESGEIVDVEVEES